MSVRSLKRHSTTLDTTLVTMLQPEQLHRFTMGMFREHGQLTMNDRERPMDGSFDIKLEKDGLFRAVLTWGPQW